MANKRQQTRKTGDLSIAADAPVPPKTAVSSQGLLIFRLDGERFGMPLSDIAEIIRLPKLVHMPLVPPSLLGLANLRGAVLPVVSLRALLRLPDVEANELNRVIVMRGDAGVGFVVDRVDHLLSLPADRIARDIAGAGMIDAALLDGVIESAEGGSPIQLLNPSRVLNGQFVRLGLAATYDASTAPLSMGPPAAPASRTLVSLFSFYLCQQEYALPLDRVREIIPWPDHIAEVSGPETAVLGDVTVRNRLLPLVSLRTLVGLPAEDLSRQRGKVVVMSLGDGAIGLAVDATREILRLDPDHIDPAPALLTRGEGDAEIVSICRLDDGRRLIALLSADRLFRSELVRRTVDDRAAPGGSGTQAEVNAMADEQFVIFRLDQQDYAIPVSAVREVARPPVRLTPVPKAPAFVDGVMNLRGRVVPIVDLRRRFDLGVSEQAGSGRILMIEVGEVIVGFLVDSVLEILKVTSDAICPAPELSVAQMRLISRVINIEAGGRLILLVDPAQLLDQVEADLLAEYSQSRCDQSANAS